MSVYDELDFAPVLITDVFESMAAAGQWFDLSKGTEHGTPETPYVARSGGANGIGSFVPHQGFDAPNPGNALTIGVSTSTVFYQPVSFYTSKEIQVLRHHQLNAVNGPVLVSLLRQQMGKFQWGNGASLARLAATRIMVPVTRDAAGKQVVDWDGMTRLGRELLDTAIAHTHSARQAEPADAALPLPDLRFEPMLITDVFESVSASAAWYDKNKVKPGSGSIPYISRSGVSNGYESAIAAQDVSPTSGNAITVGVDTQTVFYQPVDFYTSVKIQVLRHPELNETNGPILVSLLRQQMGKFQWGNGASLARLAATRVMVPVTSDPASGGQVVDWDGMDRYGRILRARAELELATATDKLKA